MEKRFVLFIVLTMIVLSGHVFIQSRFAPPPPPADENAEGIADDLADSSGDAAAADQADAQQAAESPPVVPTPPDATAQTPPLATDLDARPEWYSIGSYDGTEGPLLVTFSSEGAGLVRVELVERLANGKLRYRNLEETSGYPGHLQLTETDGAGCRINVVGRGTPAALATPLTAEIEPGLQAGDVITAVVVSGGSQVDTLRVAEFERLIAATRPGDSIELTVRRGSGGQSKDLQFRAELGVRPFQVIRPDPLAPGPDRARSGILPGFAYVSRR